jgi:hypothetical protein
MIHDHIVQLKVRCITCVVNIQHHCMCEDRQQKILTLMSSANLGYSLWKKRIQNCDSFFYVSFPFKRVPDVQTVRHMNETYSMKSAKLSSSFFQGSIR